jgi:hypothetical protein
MIGLGALGPEERNCANQLPRTADLPRLSLLYLCTKKMQSCGLCARRTSTKGGTVKFSRPSQRRRAQHKHLHQQKPGRLLLSRTWTCGSPKTVSATCTHVCQLHMRYSIWSGLILHRRRVPEGFRVIFVASGTAAARVAKLSQRFGSSAVQVHPKIREPLRKTLNGGDLLARVWYIEIFNFFST